MYLEQEAAFLSGKYKKACEEQKKARKHWTKPANVIIEQKYIIN